MCIRYRVGHQCTMHGSTAVMSLQIKRDAVGSVCRLDISLMIACLRVRTTRHAVARSTTTIITITRRPTKCLPAVIQMARGNHQANVRICLRIVGKISMHAIDQNEVTPALIDSTIHGFIVRRPKNTMTKTKQKTSRKTKPKGTPWRHTPSTRTACTPPSP